MDREKKYWITGGIIVAALILFAILFYVFADRDSDTHADHDNTVSGSTADETAPNALDRYLREQDEDMAEMMKEMEVDPTGNASLDFLEGMIPHHEAAIEMSESYLKYGGKNQELKKLARDIIDAQTTEIDQMERLIEEIEASGLTDTEKEKGYLQAYEKMMSGHQHMNHGSETAGDVEQAFAEGMLMHHQMAVDMAKAILDYTDHDEVRKLAQEIVKTQEQEIKQMQDILLQIQ